MWLRAKQLGISIREAEEIFELMSKMPNPSEITIKEMRILRKQTINNKLWNQN